MKKMFKKSLAAVLAVLMLLSVVPVASAQEISNPFDMDRLYEALEECYSKADKRTLERLGLTPDMDIKLMSTEEETLTSGMFTYTVSDNGEATITGLVYDKVTEKLIIPDTIDGYPVTVVADGALTTHFTIDLNIKLPLVKSIYIGKNVEQFRDSFNSALEEIIVDDNNQYFSSVNGILYDKAGKNIISIPPAKKIGSLTVDNIINSIEDVEKVLHIANNGACIGELKFTNSFINSFYSIVLSEYDEPTGVLDESTGYYYYVSDRNEYADFYFRYLLRAVKAEKFVVPDNNGYLSADGIGALYNKDKTALIKYPIGSSAKIYTIPETVDLNELHGISGGLVVATNSPFMSSVFPYYEFQIVILIALMGAMTDSGMSEVANEENMSKCSVYINQINEMLNNIFFETVSADLKVHVPDKVMSTLPADQILPSEYRSEQVFHNLTGANICVTTNVTLGEQTPGTLEVPAKVTDYNEWALSYSQDLSLLQATSLDELKQTYPDISVEVLAKYWNSAESIINYLLSLQPVDEFEICNNVHEFKYKVFGQEFDRNFDYYAYADNLDSSNYNPKLANIMAAFSQAVYNEDEIKSAWKSFGFTKVYLDDYYSDYNPFRCGYALSFKKSDFSDDIICLVSVRGSQSLDYNADYIGNFQIATFEDEKHIGFAYPANRIYEVIQNVMKENSLTGNVKYFITGHSRGAAVANLLSVKLMENGVNSSDVYNYNFACPDVACKNVFPSYDNIFNLCNRLDFVPYFPGKLASAFTTHGTSWGKFGKTYWFTKEFDFTGVNIFDGHNMEKIYLPFFNQQLAPGEWGSSFVDKDADIGNSFIGWVTKIMCPVDVIITDKDGNEIASVINGEVNYYDSTFGEVIILTDGDKKVIYINGDKDFDVKLIGTDDGEMTFSVERYNLQTEEVLESKTFDNVALEKGKEMYSPVSDAENTDEVKLYVVDDGDITHRITEDGTEIDYSWVNEYAFEMKSPSTTTVKYGDTLVLQADLGETALPEGWSIKWDVDGAGFNMTPVGDGLTCNMTSVANGNATVKATLVDETGEVVLNAEGNEISAEITLKSNASFWQKIVSFFKNLFRINRIIY